MKYFDLYLDSLSEKQQSLVQMTHDKIFNSIPQVHFSMKWSIPFYQYMGNLCYINQHRDAIYIGYYYGQELQDHPLLVKKDLKLTAKYYIYSDANIVNEAFDLILFDAIALNESRKI